MLQIGHKREDKTLTGTGYCLVTSEPMKRWVKNISAASCLVYITWNVVSTQSGFWKQNVFIAFYQPVSCNSHKHQYSAPLKTQLGCRSAPTPWDKKSERGWKRRRGELKQLKETCEACIHTITQTAAAWLVTMCSEGQWAALTGRFKKKKKALPCMGYP